MFHKAYICKLYFTYTSHHMDRVSLVVEKTCCMECVLTFVIMRQNTVNTELDVSQWSPVTDIIFFSVKPVIINLMVISLYAKRFSNELISCCFFPPLFMEKSKTSTRLSLCMSNLDHNIHSNKCNVYSSKLSLQ